MTDAQLPQVLGLLAAAGSTARTPETWAADDMTALLLGEPAAGPVAVMPMARRTLAVAPGRTLKVGWISANGFASRMALRRATRATAGQWPELLPELDALVVVRREAPPSYAGLASMGPAHWYTQTGFAQVLAIRCLYLTMEAPPPSPVGRYLTRLATPAELADSQPHMLAVHREVFAAYGGPVLRHERFWSGALAHHFYREHYQFQIIGLWSGGEGEGAGGGGLMGYAVVGWSGWHSKRPRMDILELATRQWDTHVAEELIRTASQLAWSKGVREVRAVVSVHDPYRSHLARTGFEDRWGYALLAKWLHPQRYLDSLATAEALGDLAVQLHSPGQLTLTLGSSASGPRTLRLQADPATLTRLLLQRLEVPTALREGTLLPLSPLASAGATDDLASRLAMALPWTPWVFHMLDYI